MYTWNMWFMVERYAKKMLKEIAGKIFHGVAED
jgi:hypothetical protein